MVTLIQLLFVSSAFAAESDVRLEQIELNLKNASHNAERSNENAKIAVGNLAEIERGLSELKTSEEKIQADQKVLSDQLLTLKKQNIEIDQALSSQSSIADNEKIQIQKLEEQLAEIKNANALRVQNLKQSEEQKNRVAQELEKTQSLLAERETAMKQLKTNSDKLAVLKQKELSAEKKYSGEGKRWSLKAKQSQEQLNTFKKLKEIRSAN